MERGRRQINPLAIGAILAAAGILGWQLFMPPVLGLANNGDFHKVLGGFNLGAPTEDEYQFAPVHYQFDPKYHVDEDFVVTEELPTIVAIALNAPFSAKGRFDLRFIGLVHAALYLAAFALLLPLFGELPWYIFAPLSGFLIFVFCDVLYATMLNSFYMDAAGFVFLLLSVVFGARVLVRGRWTDGLGLVASAILLAGSKLQHAPLALLITALIGVRPSLFLPGWNRAWRAVAIAALIAAFGLAQKAAPWNYGSTSRFSTVFYGILPRSKDPGLDLRLLGLDGSYRQYIGRYAQLEPSPLESGDFERRFLASVTLRRVGWYLLSHPRITWQLLIAGLNDAGHQRAYMGNYDRSAGKPGFTESFGFAGWSSLKSKLFADHGVRYLLYSLGIGGALAALLWSRRASLPAGMPMAGTALALMMAAAMLIAELGEPLDNVRHSFLFIALGDLVLAAIVITLATGGGSYRTSGVGSKIR